MDQNEKIVERAAEILHRYGIGRIARELTDNDVLYGSTSHTAFNTKQRRQFDGQELNGMTVELDGSQLFLGYDEFRNSSIPDDFRTLYGSFYVICDGDLVLQTHASREYDDNGLRHTSITTSGSGIEQFKAGRWLELLSEAYSDLVAARQSQDEQTQVDKKAEQAAKIDLGNYTTWKLKLKPRLPMSKNESVLTRRTTRNYLMVVVVAVAFLALIFLGIMKI